MGNSVGMRILLASAITVVITFAGFILYFDFNQRAEIREQLRSNIEEVATLAESGMANWVTARRLLVENTAQNIGPDDDAEAVAATVSRPVLRDTFAIAYYGNAEGDTTFSSPIDLPDGYDPRQRPWYKDAVAAGSTTLTEPYADASSGELVVTVATPVGAGASVRGVLGGDLTITALADLVRGVDLGGIGYAFLVNGEGTVLVHPDEGLTLKPMAEAFPKETPAATTGLEGLNASGDRLFAFFPVDGLPTVEWKLGFAIDRDKAFASLHDFRLTAIVTALIAVAAIIGLLHLLVRGLVSRPVNDMTGAMETLAEGRLDVAIPGAGKRDEIGRMARALAHFQEKLVENESLREETRRAETEKLKAEEAAERDRRQAILDLADQFETSVGSVVNGVSAASTELQASSDTMAAAARTASEQTTSAAAAVEQASNNVTVVASASEELSSSIQEISSQVAESSQVASAAVDEVRATAATVAKLAESASSINAVIDLINDIAEQTNLLALNATIEAARAGEAGKGFAVVAQEVKSLAEQTSKATEDISGQIKAMQDNTDGTVTAMDGVGKTIERINEIAATISAAVEEQSAATREISSNASQAATGTAEASQSIAGVEASASEVGETAGGVKDAADELAGQAEKLRGEVDGFIAKLRAG